MIPLHGILEKARGYNRKQIFFFSVWDRVWEEEKPD